MQLREQRILPFDHRSTKLKRHGINSQIYCHLISSTEDCGIHNVIHSLQFICQKTHNFFQIVVTQILVAVMNTHCTDILQGWELWGNLARFLHFKKISFYVAILLIFFIFYDKNSKSTLKNSFFFLVRCMISGQVANKIAVFHDFWCSYDTATFSLLFTYLTSRVTRYYPC